MIRSKACGFKHPHGFEVLLDLRNLRHDFGSVLYPLLALVCRCYQQKLLFPLLYPCRLLSCIKWSGREGKRWLPEDPIIFSSFYNDWLTQSGWIYSKPCPLVTEENMFGVRGLPSLCYLFSSHFNDYEDDGSIGGCKPQNIFTSPPSLSRIPLATRGKIEADSYVSYWHRSPA